jgi:hypothetical protein
MLLIPGVVIAVLTFPGVIFHELAHLLFCRLKRVPVYEAVYFVPDLKVQGYVLHGEIRDLNTMLLVSCGPLIVNTLLCLLICLPAALPAWFDDQGFASWFLLWLGVSVGMHAFPSHGDAEAVWDLARREAKKMSLTAILSFPLVILIHVANVLSVIWFDALYGLFIGLYLPTRILGWIYQLAR